jgi:hypothetical protein
VERTALCWTNAVFGPKLTQARRHLALFESRCTAKYLSRTVSTGPCVVIREHNHNHRGTLGRLFRLDSRVQTASLSTPARSASSLLIDSLCDPPVVLKSDVEKGKRPCSPSVRGEVGSLMDIPLPASPHRCWFWRCLGRSGIDIRAQPSKDRPNGSPQVGSFTFSSASTAASSKSFLIIWTSVAAQTAPQQW